MTWRVDWSQNPPPADLAAGAVACDASGHALLDVGRTNATCHLNQIVLAMCGLNAQAYVGERYPDDYWRSFGLLSCNFALSRAAFAAARFSADAEELSAAKLNAVWAEQERIFGAGVLPRALPWPLVAGTEPDLAAVLSDLRTFTEYGHYTTASAIELEITQFWERENEDDEYVMYRESWHMNGYQVAKAEGGKYAHFQVRGGSAGSDWVDLGEWVDGFATRPEVQNQLHGLVHGDLDAHRTHYRTYNGVGISMSGGSLYQSGDDTHPGWLEGAPYPTEYRLRLENPFDGYHSADWTDPREIIYDLHCKTLKTVKTTMESDDVRRARSSRPGPRSTPGRSDPQE